MQIRHALLPLSGAFFCLCAWSNVETRAPIDAIPYSEVDITDQFWAPRRG
jgi:hypothetical protein